MAALKRRTVDDLEGALTAMRGSPPPRKLTGRGPFTRCSTPRRDVEALRSKLSAAIAHSSFPQVEAFVTAHEQYTGYLTGPASRQEHCFHLEMVAKSVAALSPCTCVAKDPHVPIRHGMRAVAAWRPTDTEFRAVCNEKH